jgi:hypothetical protein
MNPTSSFDALVATASTVGGAVHGPPPTSPQHCRQTSSHGHNGDLDEYSPTCVFAASFDSMAAYEEQQQHYKDTATIEHHMSRISLTRSDSQQSLSLDDCYDQELMMNYSYAPMAVSGVPQPPPQVRRTTSNSRSSGLPMASSLSSSLSSSRPSDPVARLLLSK